MEKVSYQKISAPGTISNTNIYNFNLVVKKVLKQVMRLPRASLGSLPLTKKNCSPHYYHNARIFNHSVTPEINVT